MEENKSGKAEMKEKFMDAKRDNFDNRGNNCILLDKISKLRDFLNSMLDIDNLHCGTVLEMSRELDERIIEYQKIRSGHKER